MNAAVQRGLTVLGAGLTAGCSGAHAPDTLNSGDPAGRMHAAALAAAAGDVSAEGALVQMLRSDDPAERMVAIGSLERLTGERMGYSPAGSPEARRQAVARWEAWLAGRAQRARGPATVEGAPRPR
ncbi:MAG: hypothetical protein K2Q09_12010 [Phycisphaerales bacterium]|nr:hypothetical protein [Phycisphaerales bacterium]